MHIVEEAERLQQYAVLAGDSNTPVRTYFKNFDTILL